MATIDAVDAAQLTYEAFCTTYMAHNRPVLIRNVVDTWFAPPRAWRAGANGAIDFAFLKERYGHLSVPVVDGDTEEYGVREYLTMPFAEYLDLVESRNAGKKYLKDWHFVHATQSDAPVYTTPEYFQDDWLNWWWDRKDASSDDYRFVYFGPAGSITPMHHDVFRSYSWSVNIVGCKEWIFIHPDDEAKLKDKFGRSVLADVTSTDYDSDQYPHAHEPTRLHVTQVAGDAIFVPSGWYHQVKNVEDTISINHNWFNGYNVGEIWKFLQQENAAVEKELFHLQQIGLKGNDFRDQCQVVMRANTGMNYDDFRTLLQAKADDMELSMKDEQAEWKCGEMKRHLALTRAILIELETFALVD